jgi:ribonuclease D
VADLLSAPYLGIPEVIDNEEKFSEMLGQLRSGVGPFAVDAERASGYKYSARAYLIQIKREGGGLHLIDPIPFGPGHQLFRALDELWSNEEVILHASTQDLPCLRELGLNPKRLFDTELAGRIAGLPRVGLGALVESLLDVSLAKEHSAQDWSIRPLPQAWLSYAALDVELLVDLRDEIEVLLESAGKLSWVEQEFAAILAAPPPAKRIDPWRRTSGGHKIKKRQQLAVMRELWIARDTLAIELDVSPGRLLTDLAISTLAIASETLPLTNKKQLEKVLRPIGMRNKWFENSALWISVIEEALSLSEDQWPLMRTKSDALPPIKLWRDRFPEKFIPLSHARHLLSVAADENQMPIENLLTPELMRRICWNYGGDVAELTEISSQLAQMGARPWQIEVTAPLLAQALLATEALEVPESADVPELEGEESSASS